MDKDVAVWINRVRLCVSNWTFIVDIRFKISHVQPSKWIFWAHFMHGERSVFRRSLLHVESPKHWGFTPLSVRPCFRYWCRVGQSEVTRAVIASSLSGIVSLYEIAGSKWLTTFWTKTLSHTRRTVVVFSKICIVFTRLEGELNRYLYTRMFFVLI